MEIQTVHHLVHIGFDPGEHHDFERNLCNYILSIRDKTDEIVSFVDIPDTWPERSTEARRILGFDAFICDYVAILFNIGFWTSLPREESLNDFFRAKLALIPIEIKLFLKQELGDSLCPVNELRPLNDTLDREKFYASSNILQTAQYDILKKARRTILRDRTFVHVEDSGISRKHNDARRNRIGDFAREILGEERVARLFMPDGGFFHSDSEKYTRWFHPTRCEHPTDGTRYERYRNFLLQRIVRAHTDALIDLYHEGISKTGKTISSKTRHVVAGEYRACCVDTFSNVLLTTLEQGYISLAPDEFTLAKKENG